MKDQNGRRIGAPEGEAATPRPSACRCSRHGHQAHVGRHLERQAIGRRHALKLGGAGAIVAGVSLAGLNPVAAEGSGAGGRDRAGGLPKPVEGYSPILAEGFGGLEVPFFLPIEIDPFTGLPAGGPFSPSTIDDFEGVVGVVEADGVATDSDGHERRWACDIRLMKGRYVDREGHKREGAFTFL